VLCLGKSFTGKGEYLVAIWIFYLFILDINYMCRYLWKLDERKAMVHIFLLKTILQFETKDKHVLFKIAWVVSSLWVKTHCGIQYFTRGQELWLKPVILATWEVEMEIIILRPVWAKVPETSTLNKSCLGGVCLSYHLCGKPK
jgi:hypothetical protein